MFGVGRDPTGCRSKAIASRCPIFGADSGAGETNGALAITPLKSCG